MERFGCFWTWRGAVAVLAWAGLTLSSPAGPAAAEGEAGCVLTFRHGGVIQAERCEERADSVAFLRLGGWVVVLKSALVSVQDETGLTRLNPLWSAEEERARVRGLPREGGVPVAPPAREAPPPAPSPPPPTVSYIPVPVPTPVLAQPVYPVGPFLAHPHPIAFFCPHCPKRGRVATKAPLVRIVPTDPSDIGPMAVQKTFPPISPLR